MTGPEVPAVVWSLGRLWSSERSPTAPPSGERILAWAVNTTLGLAQVPHTQVVMPGLEVTSGKTVINTYTGMCLRRLLETLSWDW